MTLITSSFAIINQSLYIRNYTTGYYKKQVMISFLKDTISDCKPLYRNLRAINGVKDVALSRQAAGSQDTYHNIYFGDIKSEFMFVSRNYLEALGVKIVQGRNFKNDDTNAIIMNEAALKKYSEKIKFDSIQKHLGLNIVGICSDFNFKTLRQPICPLILQLLPDDYLTCVNIITAYNCNQDTVAAKAKMVLDAIDTDYSHTVKNFDTIYQLSYQSEIKEADRISALAIISIIISIMGICGMIILNNEYQRKEFAIRKAFGASNIQLFIHTNLKYYITIIISYIITLPLSNYFINKWYSQFYYHASFSYIPHLLSLCTIVSITSIITILLTHKYFKSHTTDILKYE